MQLTITRTLRAVAAMSLLMSAALFYLGYLSNSVIQILRLIVKRRPVRLMNLRAPVFWSLLLAATLCLAAISLFFNLLWNRDVIYFINLGVSVWAVSAVTAERARLWGWVSSISLFAMTIFALPLYNQGYSFGFHNLFWKSTTDLALWLTPGLLTANYVAVIAVAIRAVWLARTEEHRRTNKVLATGALAVQFVVIAVSWLFVAFAAPYARIADRKALSSTHVYEKWLIDYGGTSGYGCYVYEIHTFGLFAKYDEIDPNHQPSPIEGGCGG